MSTINQQAFADRSPATGVALLTSATVATNGVWHRLGGLRPFTVTVSGSFVGQVMLLVANQNTPPADSDNNFPQIDTTITAPAAIQIEGSYTWIKAVLVVLTGGSVSCHVNAG